MHPSIDYKSTSAGDIILDENWFGSRNSFVFSFYMRALAKLWEGVRSWAQWCQCGVGRGPRGGNVTDSGRVWK